MPALNVKNEPLGVHQVYRGSTSASLVTGGRDRAGASAFGRALVHRRERSPLGRPVSEPGGHRDLEFLDHLIVGHRRWVSMREQGLMG